MDKTMPDSFMATEAIKLLDGICTALEADKVPIPPDLLNWWISYKRSLEPRIQLVN